MRFFSLNLLFASILILASSCARPNISIDATELIGTPWAAQPIGLLEVHRANSGDTIGLSVGESLSESAYCTATVLADNTVLTSSDCIGNQDGSFEVKNMEFHLRRQNENVTDAFQVREILRVNPAQKTAIFNTMEALPEQVVAPSLQPTPLTPAELANTLVTETLSVPGPNRDGVAEVKLSSTVITIPLQRRLPPQQPAPTEDPDGISGPVETLRQEDGPTAWTQEDDTLESYLGQPRGVIVSGLRDGTWGAPVFLNGRIVGIVKNQQGDHEGSNAQWILGL